MTDKCLTCGREFEDLTDYPIIYITSLNRVEIPEFIGDSFGELHPATKSKKSIKEPVPKAVHKLFQETGEAMLSHKGVLYQRLDQPSHDGLVWYRSSRDITEAVKAAISNPQIKQSLLALERLVGREVLTKKLLALPGFRGGIKAGGYDDLSLSFVEAGKTQEGLRICTINLNGGWEGGSMSCASLSQDLAQMNYDGRVHK